MQTFLFDSVDVHLSFASHPLSKYVNISISFEN